MKDVYVIKVKTKPPLSSLYPSERRYSASTVGGLSLVHLGLSFLSFLLGTLAKSLQGPILSLACLVPFISGLFAWRKWYIDKNISFFFYGSIFSLVVSILCGTATVFEIAVITDAGISPIWKFENIFEYPADKRFIKIVEQNETDEVILKILREEEEDEEDDDEEDVKEAKNCNDTSSEYEKIINCTNSEKIFEGKSIRNGIFSFLRRGWSSTRKNNLLLDINVLVTCILELCWSLLSVKISLRGMRNRILESSYDIDKNRRFEFGQRAKTRAPNPAGFQNRLNSNEDIYEDDNLTNFNQRRKNSMTDNSGPRLPLPESNKEFRERVERFLANQAAHRIVEGSCS